MYYVVLLLFQDQLCILYIVYIIRGEYWQKTKSNVLAVLRASVFNFSS